MTRNINIFALAVVLAVSACIGLSAPAAALGLKACAEKYNAAKAAGSLGSLGWNDFRKAQCSDGAAAVAPSATAPAIAAASPTLPTEAAPVPVPIPVPGPQSAAVFPSSVSQQFAIEKPARARMHTCLGQYKVNKVANANGGLRWIEKGGGYYSQCNKRLKGTTA